MKKVIVLDSIRSMQNVGAIFRNCDGAGFQKIILTGHTPIPPRSDISKTALGAENFIEWEYYEDIMEALESLKKEGYEIISVELTPQAIDYKSLISYPKDKVCLVMGNEIHGVSAKVLNFSDKHVIIPMEGKKNSLNVSVAAGIVMYILV